MLMSQLAIQIRGVSYKPYDLHAGIDDTSVVLLRANNIDNGAINFDDVVYVDRSKVSNNQMLKKGDILICASSGSKNLVGKAAQVDFDGDATFGAFCKVVRPTSIDADYLGMYFQSPNYRSVVSNLARGANINNIKNDDIDNLLVNIVNNGEYKDAVSIFKKTLLIIHSRQQQLQKLDELVKARFVEMFGDMLLNPKAWKEQTLDSMADVVSGITKGRKTKDQHLIDVPYMAVSNVKDGYIDWTTIKTISATKQEINQYRLLPDDVLMTEGGDPDKLGRGAIIKAPLENCIHQNHIFRVRLNESLIFPIFFAEYLKHQKAKRYFLGCAKQTTGIASINMRQLKALPVLLPPLQLQEQFATFVEQAEKTKAIVQKALDEARLLFDSLMQQYFS